MVLPRAAVENGNPPDSNEPPDNDLVTRTQYRPRALVEARPVLPAMFSRAPPECSRVAAGVLLGRRAHGGARCV